MSEILKLAVGVACIVVLAVALGMLNLEEYGLGNIQQQIEPVVSDIQAAVDYFKNDFMRDVEQKMNEFQRR